MQYSASLDADMELYY